jgi:hypothetical protein
VLDIPNLQNIRANQDIDSDEKQRLEHIRDDQPKSLPMANSPSNPPSNETRKQVRPQTAPRIPHIDHRSIRDPNREEDNVPSLVRSERPEVRSSRSIQEPRLKGDDEQWEDEVVARDLLVCIPVETSHTTMKVPSFHGFIQFMNGLTWSNITCVFFCGTRGRNASLAAYAT